MRAEIERGLARVREVEGERLEVEVKLRERDGEIGVIKGEIGRLEGQVAERYAMPERMA